MKNRRYLTGLLILLMIFSFSACVDLQKPYVERNQFVLDVNLDRPLVYADATQVIKLDEVSIAPQFDTIDFIYRKTDTHYLTDYYNIFMTPPTDQIKQNLINYLTHSQLFKYVSDNSDIIAANYLLKTNVLELYADYRDNRYPKAVMTIHFSLFKIKKDTAVLILNKTYRQAILLPAKNSATLVNGWNVALENILGQLTETLAIKTRPPKKPKNLIKITSKK